jgi:hypothetical protein
MTNAKQRHLEASSNTTNYQNVIEPAGLESATALLPGLRLISHQLLHSV